MQMISNAIEVNITKLWTTQNYVFFSPWCKFLLSKLQSLFYLAIPNQFYKSLLLEMEKQLRICVQYLHEVFSHEEIKIEKRPHCIWLSYNTQKQILKRTDIYGKMNNPHLKELCFWNSTTAIKDEISIL